MHTGRIVFHIMRMKQKWTVAFNGTKQAQVAAQCIVSKAVMCGVHIDVEFQGKSCEFRVDYSEALPYTEIAVVDNGLSREEALDGYVHGSSRSGQSEIQSEAFDMVANIQNMSHATNESLSAHMAELEKQDEMTQKMKGRVQGFEKRTKKIK